MSVTTTENSSREPAWDVARLFPDQGTWSVDDYLELTNSTNRLVELNDGCIEVLAMPTEAHQLILRFLFLALHNFVSPLKAGIVLQAGIRVRTVENSFREPDLVFMLEKNRERRGNDFWDSADLVMEVVSPDTQSRERDLNKKRIEYAAAGIAEYWIVDPKEQHIRVLRLAEDSYSEAAPFIRGTSASSFLLPNFSVEVSEVFDAANE